MATPLPASDPQPNARRSGPSAALALWLAAAACATGAGLDDPVRASWKSLPLREWTTRTTELAGTPVILDRRLDPGTPVTFAGDGQPLRDAMAAVAAAADAEVAELRSSIRIVPRGRRELCERAEDARDREIARLPAEPRAALRARSPWAWPVAARPRDLVAAVAAEAGVAPLDGIADLPHDHFPAAQLPAMSRAEKIDLVLAHFDRRVEWRTVGGVARGAIVPLDTNLPPRRRVPARKPADPKPLVSKADVFSLRTAAPLDELLVALTDKFRLELEIDRDSLRARGISPREIVRVDVRDVTREQLLDEVLGPVGLVWRIEGERLRVRAAPPAGGGE